MDHSKSVDILGIKYHDIKDTMVDMLEEAKQYAESTEN